jgi:tetrahydromethanopterin S-methyltransferase subunit A
MDAAETTKATDDGGIEHAAAMVREAADARKCWACGCLRQTLDTIDRALPVPRRPATFDAALRAARERLVPERYECLGCDVCFPAVALNDLAADGSIDPTEAVSCPTDVVEERAGWPPLPGDYHVVRYGAPVAVCTLNSAELATTVAEGHPLGLAIAGTMHTENLGIERLITNVLANPEIRFLILSGEDTRRAVGHLPGQSLQSLFEHGVDERGRIVDARGKRPVLKNLAAEEIAAFRAQVELVPMIGASDPDLIAQKIEACAARSPGPMSPPFRSAVAPRIQATNPGQLILDKAGYFVVYPEPRRRVLIVEHYKNSNVLDCVIEGRSAGAIYSEVIARELITRLDHAAYLGRELARAEESLQSGRPFIQDAAPGELVGETAATSCPDTSCGCAPAA